MELYSFSVVITEPDSVTRFSGRLLAAHRQQAEDMLDTVLGGKLYTSAVRGGVTWLQEIPEIRLAMFTCAFINGKEVTL